VTGSWRQNSAKGKRLDSELLRHRDVCVQLNSVVRHLERDLYDFQTLLKRK